MEGAAPPAGCHPGLLWVDALVSQSSTEMPGSFAPSAPLTTHRLSAGPAVELRPENARLKGEGAASRGQCRKRERAHGKHSVSLERLGTGGVSRVLLEMTKRA